MKPLNKSSYTSVKTSGRDDEAVENRLNLRHQVGDGRLLGLRRSQILISLQQSLKRTTKPNYCLTLKEIRSLVVSAKDREVIGSNTHCGDRFSCTSYWDQKVDLLKVPTWDY